MQMWREGEAEVFPHHYRSVGLTSGVETSDGCLVYVVGTRDEQKGEALARDQEMQVTAGARQGSYAVKVVDFVHRNEMRRVDDCALGWGPGIAKEVQPGGHVCHRGRRAYIRGRLTAGSPLATDGGRLCAALELGCAPPLLAVRVHKLAPPCMPAHCLLAVGEEGTLNTETRWTG